MFSLTLVLHFSSAIIFTFLIAWLVRVKQEQRFWRELWQAASTNAPKKWILEWPSVFMRKLCKLSAWKYEDLASKDEPCKIDLKVWHKLLSSAEIHSVVRLENGNEFVLYCRANFQDETLDLLRKELNASMSNGQVFTLKPLGE